CLVTDLKLLRYFLAAGQLAVLAQQLRYPPAPAHDGPRLARLLTLFKTDAFHNQPLQAMHELM
ncbi:hypothetical protein EBT23_07755, partial [bacterium]|nr:hypothetical protein [bacterium]